MIDITKEEFWDNRYDEVSKKEKKESKIKYFIVKNKILTVLLINFGVLTAINTVLIYKFIGILSKL